MAQTQNIEITFGELIETVYKTAEQHPDVAPRRVAREISAWVTKGRVRFKNPSAVRHLLQEIN